MPVMGDDRMMNLTNVRERLMERLLQIGRELASILVLENLLPEITDAALELAGEDAVRSSLLLYDPNSGKLSREATTFHPPERENSAHSWNVMIAGTAFSSWQPVVTVGERVGLHYEGLKHVRSNPSPVTMAVPVGWGDLRIGVLEVEFNNGSESLAADPLMMELLSQLAAQAAVAIENARRMAEQRQYSEYLEDVIVDRAVETRQVRNRLLELGERLSEVERNYQLVVETMPGVIWKMTPDLTFTYLSNVEAMNLGYTTAEMIGRPVWEFLTPRYVPYIKRMVAARMQVLDAGPRNEIATFTLEVRAKNGEAAWMEVMSRPIYEDGRLTCFLGAMVDVTRRRKMEEKLRNLARAVEQNATVIVITDASGTIEYVNPAFERITGYTADEVLGQNPRILKSGVHPPEFYQEIWQTISRGDVWQGVVVNKKKDGLLYHESVVISPVRDEIGDIQHYIAVKEDVTARKRAEENLQRFNERIQILHDMDQAIVGAQSPQAIARSILGRVSRLIPSQRVSVVEFQEGGPSVLAVEANEGFSVDISHWMPDLYDAVRWQPYLQGVMDLGTLSWYTLLQEQLKAEGTAAYMVIPLVVEGRVMGALVLESRRPGVFSSLHVEVAAEVGTIMSVALRQTQLRTSLEQRTLELEAQNAELDAFAHTVAHDLKNPLWMVSSSAEMLATEGSTMRPAEIEELAHFVAGGAYKATEIVNNLLLLASTHKVDVELQPLDMSIVVNQAMARGMHLIQLHQPEIKQPENWPIVWGYAPWVEEVWANYISNALKYGGRPPVLELGYSLPDQSDGLVTFWLQDNGPGLTAEEMARLFMPFERLSQLGSAGHGLGLSIVKRIVEKLGGEVGVESVVGEGCRFYFRLPGGIT